MPLYGESTDKESPSRFMGFAGAAGAGAAVGAGAAEGYEAYRKIKMASSVGFWGTLALGGLTLLEGNAAQPQANTAMTMANAITSSGALVAGDTPYIRGAIQNLAAAVQNLTPGGYTGLSTNVQALASPSSPVPAPVTNNTWLILLGGAILLVVAAK